MYSNLDIINYNLIKNLFKEEKYFFVRTRLKYCMVLNRDGVKI